MRVHGVFVLSLLLLAGSACGSAQPAPAQGDPCSDVDLDVERVWSAQIRAEFLQQGGSIGGEHREAVATRMDDISRDWAMLRRSVCLDYFRRHVITRQEYTTRADCLDRNLQSQRSAVTTLKAGAQDADSGAMLDSLTRGMDQCRAH